ncbi:glycoside hydrolase family 18 protein [Metabacillus sp. GX 13764]|uniref:glycosyl hydrolase family 18 protein n=1 Tax=Metabacillus kandeliae TaxID=2900151 RepID=UPI001E546CF5|nr:glycoside hydrolase family 18 protein [Metabacillus kandeliae]MCD7036726.1 glycoside hydrolase family 18 protein [Metabacillus kandeliae]
MQIHVVKQGQSINEIAGMYGSTVTDIVRANDLPNPDRLVIGQTVVIPIKGQFYLVKSGDSFYSIGSAFGVSAETLAKINGLDLNKPLKPGDRLYIPEAPKRKAEVNAYIEPAGNEVSPALEERAREAARSLTYLGLFSFRINPDGTLKEPPIGRLKEIADSENVTLMMIVTNLSDEGFSDEIGRIVLNEQAVQNKVLDNIVAAAKKYGFRDIHFDMEYLRPVDKKAYLRFLRRAKERFKKEGWLISAALAPKIKADQKGKWYEAHDYKGVGEIVDFVVIMTYEWGYSGGPPLAVSPINPVKQVLNYALTEIPANKIMMGQNLYGYDWTLPYKPGGEFAKAISPQQAILIAAKYNVPIEYSEKDQAPHFTYKDENGKDHEVWFEDARSIQAKFDLIKQLKLRGISYWKLGLPFPQNWLLIQENFEVEKKTPVQQMG